MISVLMPVYNTDPTFLAGAIESCLHQTIEDYEIIIIDNESDNPETLNVLSIYSKKDKIKIYVCPREKDKNNISIALNMGLEKSKYNIIARMDSDDLMFHDRLEKQVRYMQENPEVDIVGAQMKIIPDNYYTNHPLEITPQLASKSSWFINHPTVTYRRQKIINIGGYKDMPQHGAEDYILWMTAIRNKVLIKNMHEPVLFYRSHGNNLTRQREKHQSYYSSIKFQQNKLKEMITTGELP